MSELGELVKSFVDKIPFLVSIILFFVYLLISSDVFFSRVLKKIDGATDLDSITTYGILVQATILTIVFIFVDIIVDYIKD